MPCKDTACPYIFIILKTGLTGLIKVICISKNILLCFNYFFRKYDVNGDGKLSKEELKPALQSIGNYLPMMYNNFNLY